MIDGLKLKMSGKELKQLLTARIAYHNGELERFRAELARSSKEHSAEHPLLSPSQCREEMARHSQRSAGLMLILRYLSANEVYLLNETDLRSADLWPEHEANISATMDSRR